MVKISRDITTGAKEEAGVRFVKSRITQILPVNGTGDLLIRYTDELRKTIEEIFDLVVLSVGLAVRRSGGAAKRLDIHLDPYSSTTSSFETCSNFEAGHLCLGASGPRFHPSSNRAPLLPWQEYLADAAGL